MKVEDAQASITSDATGKLLKTEADFKRADLEVQVLQRDKNLLLEELQKCKEKEKTIIYIWEGNN
jgi:hypothetical protein